MDLDAIRELVRLMKENGLSEVDIESAGEHVRLRAAAPPPMPHVYSAMAPPALAPPHAAAETAGASDPLEIAPSTVIIKSPIVGTYYHSATPDKPPFVASGDTIDENSVLCIIEAMKVMNEIKAEMRGVVRENLVQNGQPVEFGQPLFAIEPIP